MIKQLFIAFILLVASVLSAHAQGAAEQAAKAARDRFSDIKNRSVEIERMKRDAGKRSARNDSAVKFPEIKEDFEEIQKLNADLFKISDAEPASNYAAIAKLATEINRRAARLQSNLFSPNDEHDAESKNKESKSKRAAQKASEIKTLLANLDKSVNKFVHNAMFRNVKIVNSEDSLAAQNDLAAIVKISFSLKEKIKNLKETDSVK